MKRSLQMTVYVLAALCVLLLAGAFPLMGAEGVYRSGAMMAVAILLFLLLLWAGWCLARAKQYCLAGVHVFLAMLLGGVGADATMGLRESFVMTTHAARPVTELRVENGGRLSLGCALTLRSFEVNRYQGTGQVRDYVALVQVDDAPEPARITVNKPLHHKGWIFSLMDYRHIHGITIVRFQARRAPGRLLVRLSVVVGALLLFIWCWIEERRKHAA